MNGYRSGWTAAHIAIDFHRWLSKAFEKQSLAQRCLAAVPFIVLILYIQFTTEKLRISAPASSRAWAEVFHSELLIVLFIFFVPFLFGFFRRHYLAVLCAFYLVCFLDFVSWFTIDRPIQPTDLLRGAAMIRDYSEFIGQLGRPLLAKILFLALAPIAIWLFGKWTLHKRLAARLTNIAPKAFFGAALVYVGALPFVYKPGYFQHNTFIRIGEEAVYQSRLARLPADTATLQKLFGISTPSLDQPAASAPATGARKNVVIFIIETAPWRYYPDLLKRFAGNGAEQFASRAFTSTEHYTTYPESYRSIFSILTGQYPPPMYKWMSKPNYAYSLPRVLRAHGYSSYLVSTAPLEFLEGLTLMQHISFDRLIQSRLVRKAFEVKEGRIVWDRSRIYGADLEMFDSTAGVIHEHASQNASPFLLVFTPQSSHAPFQLPPGMNVPLSDHAGLVRANAEWQYKLIDRLIAKLKETNQFSNTIFVVTGDHGIRSVYETNQLFENPQLLNEVSFRVPFWIFNAGRLDLKNPDWATSHIDVTPTILDLLGIPYAPTSYQGRTMLHPTERVVFFLGGEFLSPNGFKYGNRFYMENRRRKIVLVRSSFDFNTAPKTADAVSPDQFSTQGIEQTIATVQKFLHHK